MDQAGSVRLQAREQQHRGVSLWTPPLSIFGGGGITGPPRQPQGPEGLPVAAHSQWSSSRRTWGCGTTPCAESRGWKLVLWRPSSANWWLSWLLTGFIYFFLTGFKKQNKISQHLQIRRSHLKIWMFCYFWKMGRTSKTGLWLSWQQKAGIWEVTCFPVCHKSCHSLPSLASKPKEGASSVLPQFLAPLMDRNGLFISPFLLHCNLSEDRVLWLFHSS